MNVCNCCEHCSDEFIKGLCRRCYNYFYINKMPINDENLATYSTIFKVVRLIDRRPLNKGEVVLFIDSVRVGILNKLPHRFWTGMYSYDNALLALDYWLQDVLELNVCNLGAPEVRELLKDSPISWLTTSTVHTLGELLYDLKINYCCS